MLLETGTAGHKGQDRVGSAPLQATQSCRLKGVSVKQALILTVSPAEGATRPQLPQLPYWPQESA